MEVLNIQKLNIYQILTSMFKIKTNTALHVCQTQFTDIQHQYSTRLSKNSPLENQLVYSYTEFSVSPQGSRLWCNFLDHEQNVQ